MPFVNCDTDAFYLFQIFFLFRKLLDAKLYLCFFKVKNNLCNIKYLLILLIICWRSFLHLYLVVGKSIKKNFSSSALTVMNITELDIRFLMGIIKLLFVYVDCMVL